MKFGFKFQLLPQRGAFQIYNTSKCIYEYRVHRGQQHVTNKGPFVAPRPALRGYVVLVV
jgi:hypothetical protein